MDIGSLLGIGGPATPALAQPSTDGQTPGLQDQWSSYLENPANKAALLGFGLKMLAGGWGNTASQIGEGIGAGVEAGANVGANQQKEADTTQARQDKLNQEQLQATLEREKMGNQRDIASTYANSRLDVANIRSGARPTTAAEANNFSRTAAVTAQGLRASLPYLQGQLTEDQVQAQALDAAERELLRSRAAIGQGNAAGGGSSGFNGVPAADQGGQGGMPGQGAPGNSNQTNGTPSNGPLSSSYPPGTRRRNPTTGKIIEFDGKQWNQIN